jgi:hypothetical protein
MSSTTQTLEEKMTDYQKVLRKKIGEFMLVINDLLVRGVVAHPTLNTVRTLEDIVKTITEGNKKTTNEWAEDPEITTLMTLLYNNGYPFQLYNHIAQTVTETQTQPGNQTYPENNLFDNGAALYKSYIIFGDLTGGQVENPNHYTVAVPNEILGKVEFPNGIIQIDTTDTAKIQVPGDGHCFYKAFSIWCMAYGVTIDHLENLSYNVPFEFNIESHKQNFKVDLTGYTDENNVNIPKPIGLPKSNTPDTYGFSQFKTDALIIAQNMKNKIQNTDFNPTFEEKFKNIKESKEYENYDGLKKDNGTHCNKYKGNIEQE